MVYFTGIWIFSLSRYCVNQFSFFRHRYRTLISSACLMLELGFKQHDLVRTMFTGLAKQLMKPGSVPHYAVHGYSASSAHHADSRLHASRISLITLTRPFRLRGGVKGSLDSCAGFNGRSQCW